MLPRYRLGGILPALRGGPLPHPSDINVTGRCCVVPRSRHWPDAARTPRWAPDIRLLAGTGVMSAFTAYSTLALEAPTFPGSGRIVDGLLYFAATLIGVPGQTVAGIRIQAIAGTGFPGLLHHVQYGQL